MKVASLLRRMASSFFFMGGKRRKKINKGYGCYFLLRSLTKSPMVSSGSLMFKLLVSGSS